MELEYTITAIMKDKTLCLEGYKTEEEINKLIAEIKSHPNYLWLECKIYEQ